MKVLSIRQPWAWLIANGLKDIENRTWKTHFRGEFLIHAGLTMTKADYEETLEFAHLLSRSHPFPEETVLPARDELARGCIVGIAEITNCVQRSSSPWFFGKHGFVIKNARPLKPITCLGQLGFFTPSDYVLNEVRKQISQN